MNSDIVVGPETISIMNSPKYVCRASTKKMLKPIADLYRDLLLSRLAGHRLRALADRCGSDFKCLVSLAFSYRLRHPALPVANIKPAQIFEEIFKLAETVKDLNPKKVLEIGTVTGGTLFLFYRLASEDATIISIDPPSGPFGGGYRKWRIPVYVSFAKKSQMLHLVRADSHDPKAINQIKQKLEVGTLMAASDR